MPDSTVLVVDDDPVILKLLEVNFDMEGFGVLLAHDGEEGIAVARAERPDLIVSDIMMPRVSGSLLAAALNSAPAAGVEPPAAVSLERPARREHGDWSSNVALATAKAAGRNPRELAQQLVDALAAAPPAHVDGVELAGPGFVNFRLRPTWLHDVLVDVVAGGEEGYARSTTGGGRRVNVEFVSANPTGPLHAGGGRWAAYGDTLCNLLERTGHVPHREYYLNDRGVQIGLFAASLAARRAGDPLPEGGYAGDYITEWAAEMPDGADPAEWGYERVKRDLEASLRAIGVEFDTWFSERSMVESGAIDATLADLRAKGAAYDADGAVWLRTTDFGDDKDRVLVKSDGEPTYLLPDIAYHRDKFARGWQLLIDIWGADHHGYVARLKTGVRALGHDPDELEIILGQLVSLVKGGEEVRLSKRAGTIVLLDDVVAAAEREPHQVTTWVRELAGRFHGFYHDCYVIGDVPPALTQARLWLVEAARIGLVIALGLLGVSAPEAM